MGNERRHRLALSVAAALPAIALVALMGLVERPLALLTIVEGRTRRAAVAIRDDVIPFQKWGTRAFTLPYLDRQYDRVDYFTQTSADDRRGAFVVAVAEAARTHDSVDLFLLAHGNHYVEWLDELAPESARKLRLVYNTGCADASQAPRWIALGADAYVGHVGESQSPIFFVYFLRRWSAGWNLADAVSEANVETAAALRRLPRTTLFGVDATSAEAMVDGSLAVCTGASDLTIES
jgi:hypothetical protein